MIEEICIYCGLKRYDHKEPKQACFKRTNHDFRPINYPRCIVCGEQFKQIIPGQKVCNKRECLLRTEKK